MNSTTDTTPTTGFSPNDALVGPITFQTPSFEFTADILATFPAHYPALAASVNNGLYFLVRAGYAQTDTAELIRRIQENDGNPLLLELDSGEAAYTGTLAGSGADVQFLAVYHPH